MSSFATYFSHRWSHDALPLNKMLWQEISKTCHLLIDLPTPTVDFEKPYFISRLEFLMRHADAFVCCLPAETPRPEASSIRDGDFQFRKCSPYILFELRLAERLDLPRLVLYDRASMFKRPNYAQQHAVYIERRFDELDRSIRSGQKDDLLMEQIDSWLRWLNMNRSPSPWTIPQQTACLLRPSSDIAQKEDLMAEAIESGGFERPVSLLDKFSTDSELLQALRSIGLLVVDVSDPELLPLYHVAHSLMVPTVRLSSLDVSDNGNTLPRLLRGHPAGYQHDLIEFRSKKTDEVLFQQIEDRAQAAARSVRPVFGEPAGIAELYRRTYKTPNPPLVFISHNEKADDRLLVELLVESLDNRGIKYWEYALENRSGDNWRINMNNGLAKATMMIALVAPRYEKSPGCMEEWNYAMEHKLPLFPFLTRGRTESVVMDRQSTISHESRLSIYKFPQQAELIADTVARFLQEAPHGVVARQPN